MSICSPGSRLLTRVPLAFVSKRLAQASRPGPDVSLNLTSMIDFLTVVVIFLLMSFSASGETARGGVELPEARHTRSLERAPIVTITRDVVALEMAGAARRISDVPSLVRDAGTTGDLRIDGLVQDLETLKTTWSLLHPREPFPAAVVVEADRTTDFRLLKKVLYSCSQAGYGNISLMVHRIGRPSA